MHGLGGCFPLMRRQVAGGEGQVEEDQLEKLAAGDRQDQQAQQAPVVQTARPCTGVGSGGGVWGQ